MALATTENLDESAQKGLQKALPLRPTDGITQKVLDQAFNSLAVPSLRLHLLGFAESHMPVVRGENSISPITRTA